ncbi:hypothetical protein HKD37_04G009876 [Glycine soja]
MIMYDSVMSKEVYMNDKNEDEGGVNEEHVDCSNAINTSQARSVAYEIGFVAVIMRSDTNNGIRGRISFDLIGCERIGHPYASRLTKSMVKPRNILLTLKKYNANSYTTIKQICNARNAYCSSIRDSNTEMQQLMKLLEQDQLKDEGVVRDIFWSDPDAVKLSNAYNLVFLIDNTYKTNRHMSPLLDIVGVTPTRMTSSVAFTYLEGEHLNNVVWALQRFQDLTLMNVAKIAFPKVTNLLCQFHIDKNVKAKSKILKPRGVWRIVLLSNSLMSALRSLKLLAHYVQCLLTMSTKHGYALGKHNNYRSQNVSKNITCTCATLLLAKSVQPSRHNKYARAATIDCVASHLLQYTSHSHDSRTYDP